MIDSIAALRGVIASLAELRSASTEVEAIGRLTVLEEIKSACAAAQARDTARLVELRAAGEELRGIPKAGRGRGLTSEVGLARKASPRRGGQYLGFARALVQEMPCALAALTSGVLTEWRATILVRETAFLTRESRAEADRRLCADPATLIGVGDRELDAQVKAVAYELEPAAVVARKAKADKDRRVSVRPAPDLMTQLSAVLPMTQGIAVYASLKKYADSRVGADDRTHAQIMADTLVERVTGQISACAVPVAVTVVMSDRALLGGADVAEVPGYGPVPADIARSLIADAVDSDSAAASSIRRLYARPSDGALVSMDARSRGFPKALSAFIVHRDKRCRTPYCDAPIAEIDHAHPHHNGGATSAHNADGICTTHNRAKEADGWRYDIIDTGGRHRMEVRTPTGVVHISLAPPPVGFTQETISATETRLRALLAAA